MAKRSAPARSVVLNIRNVDPSTRRRLREMAAHYELRLGPMLAILVRLFTDKEREARKGPAGAVAHAELEASGLPMEHL